MAVRQRHFTGVITLDATPQNVATALGLGAGLAIRDISLQADPANLNPFYVGHDANLSSATFGTLVPVPATTNAPYMREGFADGTMLLAEWYVRGTNLEKVHVDVCLQEYASV